MSVGPNTSIIGVRYFGPKASGGIGFQNPPKGGVLDPTPSPRGFSDEEGSQ